MKKRTIKVVDIDEIIKPQEVKYNESLLDIEHDEPSSTYRPIKRSFGRINEARYKRLVDTLK